MVDMTSHRPGSTNPPRTRTEGDAYVDRIERIASDPLARRRLLWLRARERRDGETAAALQRSEPNLLRGFDGVRERVDELDEQSEYERSKGFALLWCDILSATPTTHGPTRP
jgi:hypothetical protein